MSKRPVAASVRLFHNTDVKPATDVVDALVDRTSSALWEVAGVKRVLDTRLSLTDQTLLLLYSEPGSISDKDLAKFLEQDRLANYRRVLDRLHKARAIEWNTATGTVTLSPRGREDVEDRLLKQEGSPQHERDRGCDEGEPACMRCGMFLGLTSHLIRHLHGKCRPCKFTDDDPDCPCGAPRQALRQACDVEVGQ